MNWEDVIGILVTVALLVYLTRAMLKAEET